MLKQKKLLKIFAAESSVAVRKTIAALGSILDNFKKFYKMGGFSYLFTLSLSYVGCALS